MKARRKLLLALGLGALAAAVPAVAQQPDKVWRVGFLGSVTAAGYATRVEALRVGLRELGYVEGRNLTIEFRWAEDDYARLPELANELVRLKVDVIVTHGTAGARAAKRATASIPIVFGAIRDPVAAGLVTNLARPAGNVTGLTYFGRELAAKRLELLKQAFPATAKVAYLLNPDNPGAKALYEGAADAAGSLKLALPEFAVRRPEELERVFVRIVKERIAAVACDEDPMLNVQRTAIARLALKHRLVLAGNSDLAAAGGLIGYGVNFPAMFRRAAAFVDKILKGMPPGDIPIERASRFELVANLKTAKAIGRKIPQSLLGRADRVIE